MRSVVCPQSDGAKVAAVPRGNDIANNARAGGATEAIATGGSIAEGINGHQRSLDLVL